MPFLEGFHGWVLPTTSTPVGSPWVQGGNSFGAIGVLGTNDLFPLTFVVNAAEYGRFTASGSFLLGATTGLSGERLLAVGGIAAKDSVGKASYLQTGEGSNAAPSDANSIRIIYDEINGDARISVNSGPFAPLAVGGVSPWFDAGVYTAQVNPSHNVVIGSGVEIGTQQLQVLGDALYQPIVDSTAAFSVTDAAALPVLTVDTVNSLAVANTVRISSSGGAFIEADDGTTAAVSSAGEGRLRYKDTEKSWQASVDTGPWYNLVTTNTLPGLSSLPKLGNVALVDAVNGNDATASVNGPPYLTIPAALTAIGALGSPGTVWIMPGTYALSAGITIPTTCAIRGMNTQTTVISWAAGATIDPVLLTMGENTRVEDVTLTITSTATSGSVTGVRLPATTAKTSKIRTCVVNVNNSSVAAALTGPNAYGILSDGVSAFSDQTFSFNCVRASTINVYSNGAGQKFGVHQPFGFPNQMSLRDTNIFLSQPVDPASTGTYAGVFTAEENSQCQLRSCSISGPPYAGSVTNPPVVLTALEPTGRTGTPILQGVTLVAGDRVLCAGEVSNINNGIYVVAAGAWSRAADLPAGANGNGTWLLATSGYFAGIRWLCTSPIAPLTAAIVGTNPLVFSQSSIGADVKLTCSARYVAGTPTGTPATQGTYVPASGDRVLLDIPGGSVNNGIWVLPTPLGGAWSRAGDFPIGANTLNAYTNVRLGTYAATAWICTSAGTITTPINVTSLTFSQKYLGCDVFEQAPQAVFGQNGIQVGPGTDLVTKTAGGQPFTTFVYPTTLSYGLNGNVQSGVAYLWVGVQPSPADPVQSFFRFQQATIVQGLSFNMRNSPGLKTLTITVQKSLSGITGTGFDTAMQVKITNGVAQGNNFLTSVNFEQGSYVALKISSTGIINNCDLVVELDLF